MNKNDGFVCELYDLDEFVEKVLYLNSHKQQVEQMGRNAQQVAVEKFDRAILALQVLDMLKLTVEN